jgi:hypothetical protein
MKQSFDQWWNDRWPNGMLHVEALGISSDTIKTFAHEVWLAGIASTQLPVVYGCHCDLEPGQAPDGCVLLGEGDYCIYANSLRKAGKTVADCEYWRPIK